MQVNRLQESQTCQENQILLSVTNLCASFQNNCLKVAQQQSLFALSHVSFALKYGQRLGIAGESGSGKSLLARIIMGLEMHACLQSGEIVFDGHNVMESYRHSAKNSLGRNTAMQKLLGKKITYIPQDPLSSFNPLHKIYTQIEEVLVIHDILQDSQMRRDHIVALCKELDLESHLLDCYPHELSGGQRQRMAIALALVASPKLIICDEPTTALDMFLSIQIIELLRSISCKKGIALLFISHDLGLLKILCEENLILKDGHVVELLKKNETPKHIYTKELFDANYLPQKIRNNNQSSIVFELQDFNVYIKKHKVLTKTSLPLVKNINIHIEKGKTLGIIGQSGSGKSSLAQGIMHLIDTTGKDFYFGKLLSCEGIIDKIYLKEMRKSMQIVFQDSLSALNPRFRVRDLVSEGLLLQKKSRQYITQEIEKIFEYFSLNVDLLDRYPHELSGGQRQRVAIARAMILRPKILILDEPTSALDKFVQKGILELLYKMQQEYQLTYLLITHDLSIVQYLCDDVAVVSGGKVVEYGAMEKIIYSPQHSYTKKMMEVFHRYYVN